jgi:hypothetical protein
MSKLVNVRETEGEIKNGQFRETNNKTQDEGKQNKNVMGMMIVVMDRMRKTVVS